MKGKKKPYTEPSIIRVALDNTISLIMMTTAPPPPPKPRGSGGTKDDPFQSPFSDKPFS